MKLFGTDGIRDLVGGEKMNEKIAAAFGRAIVDFCRKRNWPLKIIIGRDTRESGPMFEEAVAEGIISAGGQAVSVGVIPTPGVSYLVREEKAGAGIVVSASHNPFEHNGLKPFKNDGTKFSDEEEKEIEEYISGKELGREAGHDISRTKTFLSDGKEKYEKFLSDIFFGIFENKSISQSPVLSDLKIVLDCANGATYEVAPAIFEKVANEISLLNVKPDGKNINYECGSQHTENLKKEVLAKKAALGLAFDGDGDRVIAVDEKGNSLTGDQMIYIIAKMLKARGKLENDFVVTTVMSNLGFVSALKKLGIGHFATGVGDRPVFFEMKKRGAALGGEESGHIIYTGFHSTGDGIVGGLMLLAAMDFFGKTLSELAAGITLFPKLLLNIPVKSKPELGAIPEIQDIIKEAEHELGSEGRVLVRYSGTENLCRVMVEGRDEEEIKRYAEKIAGVIKNNLS
jgi:phosphoglucosamine mutase